MEKGETVFIISQATIEKITSLEEKIASLEKQTKKLFANQRDNFTDIPIGFRVFIGERVNELVKDMMLKTGMNQSRLKKVIFDEVSKW